MNAKLGYTRQILRSIVKHSGEVAMAVGALVTIAFVYILTATRLDVPAIGASRAAIVPVIITVLLFHFAIAAWRLYRNQLIVITTKQTLLDLNAVDRTELEQTLRAHYTKREERLETRHEDEMKKLGERLAAVTLQMRGAK